MLRRISVTENNAVPDIHWVANAEFVAKSILILQAAERARMIVHAHSSVSISLCHFLRNSLAHEYIAGWQLNAPSAPIVRDSPHLPVCAKPKNLCWFIGGNLDLHMRRLSSDLQSFPERDVHFKKVPPSREVHAFSEGDLVGKGVQRVDIRFVMRSRNLNPPSR